MSNRLRISCPWTQSWDQPTLGATDLEHQWRTSRSRTRLSASGPRPNQLGVGTRGPLPREVVQKYSYFQSLPLLERSRSSRRSWRTRTLRTARTRRSSARCRLALRSWRSRSPVGMTSTSSRTSSSTGTDLLASFTSRAAGVAARPLPIAVRVPCRWARSSRPSGASAASRWPSTTARRSMRRPRALAGRLQWSRLWPCLYNR